MAPMIMSRTPLRVSFVGGGTDIRECYSRIGGAVVSAAIDRHIHIIVNDKFDNMIRASYSKTEIVSKVDDLRHPLIREALRLLGIEGSIEILSISDIPSEGTGLGSSSSFTVGLLNALHAWLGEHVSAKQLAEEACRIEREIVKDPGGKQDQYIAAYGGLRYIEFQPDEEVRVSYVLMPDSRRNRFEESLMLFYTGVTRSSTSILKEQIGGMEGRMDYYSTMKGLASEYKNALEKGEIDRAGRIMHDAWEIKKSFSNGISNSVIDRYYAGAVEAGAYGGKITGAGGGGFLLLLVDPDKKGSVRQALGALREVDIHIDSQGSRIVYVGD
ncbi:MAG: hypothetical protein QXP70_04265 [Methanomassiliicoccales archaeon]